ncbi:GNAT family N-acetyltransferase [Planomicrobium sp. Y74]|uniref:GNAT family N-acetyltransferase n=1 Tax=Planomicrobium sp. Y74 TaxID=2478977 RepID=UPI000EF5592A|nr:GNAT family N-acetyltransferase [Planomicrobium sp. Y74]RLQ86721.1 GNAT family N-acetyltransferase [Planomicrobium sp. Y74]
MNFEFEELAWDTNYFGVKSAKITIYNPLNKIEFEELVASTQDYEFVVINNTNNHPANNVLIGSHSDAFLVDINIQFEMEVSFNNAEIYYCAQNNFQVNKAISEISNKSFNYSRFFNDPNLDPSLSGKIYFNWVNNSFNNPDKFFVVAKEDEETLGFLLFSIKENKNIVIELISLNEKAQGKGIGTKLLKSLHYYCLEEKLEKIHVGTQIDNLQAINFYQKKGFNLISKTSIYHYWPRRG